MLYSQTLRLFLLSLFVWLLRRKWFVKKRLKWLLGILLALIVIVIIDMMICIHQYGKGKVTPWQVLEVNLFHKMVALEEHDQGMLFLTDHDWTGDELLKRGYRETDLFFRLHDIKGITLEQLDQHT